MYNDYKNNVRLSDPDDLKASALTLSVAKADYKIKRIIRFRCLGSFRRRHKDVLREIAVLNILTI